MEVAPTIRQYVYGHLKRSSCGKTLFKLTLDGVVIFLTRNRCLIDLKNLFGSFLEQLAKNSTL